MSDEPRIEIAACPMPGCGGPVRIVPQRVHGLTYGYSAACVDCDYRFGRSLSTPAEAIAAHNALCADVQRGREAVRIEQERGALRAEVERLKTAIADLRYAFDDPVVVERIAAWNHKSWAGWYRWMAMKWHEVHQNTGESFRDRWKRQSETPYVKLSDSEQNSDRAEAKEVLNVLYEILPWPRFESKKGEDCEGHSIARADTGYGESSDSSGTKQ